MKSPGHLHTVSLCLLGGMLVIAPALDADSTSDELRARGFDLAYNLDHDEAIVTLKRAVAEDPDDPATYRSVAAVTWLHILFQRGTVTVDDYLDRVTTPNVVVEEPPPELAATFEEYFSHAIELAEKGVRTTPDDPNSHYDLGAAFGLAASYTATVEGNVIKALRSARRAYDAHETVLDLDPSRKDANLIVGTYRYVVATLPLPLRLMAYLVGFGGGREEGLRMIEEAAAYRSDAQTEARFALILLYNREKQYADARRVIRDLQRDYPRNRLVWLEAGATALRADRPAAAEAALNDGLAMLERDPRQRIFGEEPLWRYKRGAARVALGRQDEALADLQAALSAEAHEWVHGRTVLELGKLADLASDRERARAEYEKAERLCKDAKDNRCAEEAKKLRKSRYQGNRPRDSGFGSEGRDAESSI